jgi:hypothetical protein
MPLTMPSPEPCTIFLHALTEPQATKPSRRWQPPTLTSTTGLQHEHLMPLNAISKCKRTRMTHSLLIHNLASTSELEGSQALSSMDTKSPKVLNFSHGRGALLFIAQRLKIAVSIFCALTGRAGLGDRMHRSLHPIAPSLPRVTSYLKTVVATQWLSLHALAHLTEHTCKT